MGRGTVSNFHNPISLSVISSTVTSKLTMTLSVVAAGCRAATAHLAVVLLAAVIQAATAAGPAVERQIPQQNTSSRTRLCKILLLLTTCQT